MDMESFKEKAGPLPVYGWVLLIVGIGYLVYRKRQAAQVNSNTTDTTQAANDLNNPAFYDPAILAASYNLSNNLGQLNSQIASNTTAVSSNTQATLRDVATDRPITPSPGRPHIPNGFYRVVENGNIYQIQNDKRYYVSFPTWKKIGKKNKFTSVYNNWPGLGLPLAGAI